MHTPDTWFLKQGTTAAALRHALVGNAFTAARRRGKQIILDTRDPRRTLGVHLGMSGRVLVDDEEAGDPLIYASNRRMPKWHRFGVHFADGGDFMLRDPRRLGAVELDPDESRLGPDAFDADAKELDHALGRAPRRSRPCSWTSSASPGSATCSSTRSLWRAGIDPTRPPTTIDARRAQGAAQGDPHDAARRSTGAADRTPATCRASADVAVPAGRRAAPPRARSAAAPPTGARRTSTESEPASRPRNLVLGSV